MDEQEQPWIIVTKSHNKKNKDSTKNKKVWSFGTTPYTNVNTNVHQDIESMLVSQHMKVNQNKIKLMTNNVVSKMQSPIHIQLQCLGIGNFSKYKKPACQYIFFKHILCPILQQLSTYISKNIYDPVLDQACLSEIHSHNIQHHQFSIQQTDKNKYLHFIVMTHCQRFLYQLVMQKLYEKHKLGYQNKIIIIGNSIKEYIERCNLLKQPIPQIFNLFSYKEQKLKDYQQAFNDTYIYQLIPK